MCIIAACRKPEGRREQTDGILVCIPLPGRRRYRMSVLVPHDLATPADDNRVAHGVDAVEGERAPEHAAIREAAHGRMTEYLVAAPQAEVADTVIPVLRDSGGRDGHRSAAQPPAGHVRLRRDVAAVR